MARIFAPFQQFLDDNGDPLASGKLTFYRDGIYSIKQNTYSDASLNNPNPNPITLDGEGRLPFDVFGDGVYSVELREKATNITPDGVLIRLLDTVGGEAGSRLAFSDWTSTIQYNVPAFVIGSDGKYYRSLSNANLGNDPTLDPGNNAFWEEFVFRGIYNTQVTYSVGEVVQTSTGNIWKALLEQSANDPETDDGTNWLPAVEGSKIPEVSNLIANIKYVEKEFTGGGQLVISKLNSLQDGNTGYKLPPASIGQDGEYLIVTQALEFVSFEPVLTVDNAATETIVTDSGTDKAIAFDQEKSKDIRLTTDGVSQWRLTV